MGNAYCCCYSNKKREIIIRGELSLDRQVNSENSNHYSNNNRIRNLNNNHVNNNNNYYANNNNNYVNNNNNHANRLIRLNRVWGNNLTTQTIADGFGGLGSAFINALGNKEKNENLENKNAETNDGKNNREYNSKEYNELNTHEKNCLKDRDDVSTQLLKEKKPISINNFEHNIINENSNDEKKLYSRQIANLLDEPEINHYYQSKNNQYEQHKVDPSVIHWNPDYLFRSNQCERYGIDTDYQFRSNQCERYGIDPYYQSKKEEYDHFKIDSYEQFNNKNGYLNEFLNHDLRALKSIGQHHPQDVYENRINENLDIHNNGILPEPVNDDPIIVDF